MVATLAALVFFAGQFDLVAAGVAESRAGTTPIVVGGASQPFVAQVLRPIATVTLRDSDLTLRLDYSPRIFWQDPRPIDVSGPLLLHTATLTVEDRALRRLLLSGQAVGTYGQPDYTALAQVLGPTQAALPTITTLAAGTAAGLARVHLTPRADLDLRAQLFVWRALDVPAEAAAAGAITSQTVVSFSPGTTLRLTRRHLLGFQTAVAAAWYSTGTRYLTVTPLASWDIRLTPLQTLRTTLGTSYARPFGPGASTPPLIPVGSVDYEASVARWDGVLLRLVAGTAMNVFFDPVLGTATPRGMARGGATLTLPPDWMASLRGDFGTVMPFAELTAGDVTAFSITASIRRVISSYLYVDLGGLWGDRGPALDAADFSFHQRQLWVFVSLTGSTRALGRVGP